MDNGDSRSDSYGDRTQLFDALSNLSPHYLERLMVGVNMPRMNRAGAAAKIGDQVSALLEWADSNLGPGLDEIRNYLNHLQNGTGPIDFDFSGYLQAVCLSGAENFLESHGRRPRRSK